MKAKNYALAYLVVGMLFYSKLTMAQETGLAGNWILQKKTSLSGSDYTNTVDDTVKIAKSGNLWKLTRMNMGNTTSETLPENTQPVATTTKDNRRKVAKVTWNGEHTLVEDRSYSMPGDTNKGAFKIREEFNLSADNQTLTITRYFENPQDANDKWSAKGQYIRKQ